MKRRTRVFVSLFVSVVMMLALCPSVGIAEEMEEVLEGNALQNVGGYSVQVESAMQPEAQNVASVTTNEGNVFYSNIGEAIAGWNNSTADATLCLLANVEVPNSTTNVVLNSNKILNLNGFTFTGDFEVTQPDSPSGNPWFTIHGENGGTIAGSVTIRGANAVLESGAIKSDGYKNGVSVLAEGSVGGKFTMNGGTITSTNVDGVRVTGGRDGYNGIQSTFTMNNGMITGCGDAGVNIDDYGLYEYAYGAFNMIGGTITGNSVGVRMGNSGFGSRFNVEGNPRIVDNGSDGEACNALIRSSPDPQKYPGYLFNKITVVGELRDNAEIGVMLLTEIQSGTDKAKLDMGVFTSGYSTYNTDVHPSKFFTSDAAASGETGFYVTTETKNDATEATIAKHEHEWGYEASNDQIVATCSNATAATGDVKTDMMSQHACVNGDDSDSFGKATLKIVAPKNKTYDGQPAIATLEADKDWASKYGLPDYDANNIEYFKVANGKQTSLGKKAPKDAGTYVAKYTLQDLTIATGSFTIAPRVATIAWSNTSFTYNGKEHKPTAAVSNKVNGDNVSVTVSGSAKTSGTYKATATGLTGAQAGNYKLTNSSTSHKTSSFTIAPRVATIAWSNTSFIYDGKAHTPTAVVTNKVGGDNVSVTVGGGTKAPGTHKATATGLTGAQAGNYKLNNSSTNFRILDTTVTYKAHSQSYGWKTPSGSNGSTAGTTGKGKRLEALTVKTSSATIEYRSHVQGIGWESTWAKNGAVSGTTGQGKRLEAVQMRLTGKDSEGMSVWYRVHSQTYGWLGWAHDGEPAGTANQGKRAEAFEVMVLPKGQTPNGYVKGRASYIGYATGEAHVQSIGWQGNGSVGTIGTTGKSKRMEAIKLDVGGQPYSGTIEYDVYLQKKGWAATSRSGILAGSTGERRQIEAVRVRLTSNMSKYLSVWYRVHSQSYGWLGWAHDGEDAGTMGVDKRAEAVEVRILPRLQVPNGYNAKKAACISK